MTTVPGPSPQSPPDGPPSAPSDRYFEATIPAAEGKRWDARLALVFEGAVLVMVDADGKPPNPLQPHELSDLHVVIKTELLAYEDHVFAWVRGYRVRQGGERLGLIFEPNGRSEGRIEGLFCDLMAGLGVTEVADVTSAWRDSGNQ